MKKEKLIKLLKLYGNCYVRDIDFDVREIEKIVGFKLNVRYARNCDVGKVIERKKQ